MLELGSTWAIEDVEGLDDGTFIVLDVNTEIGYYILFKTTNSEKITRPICFSFEKLEAAKKNNNIQPYKLQISPHHFNDQNEIPDKYKLKRDSNYELIEPLINDKDFLFSYATSKRFKLLSEYAKKNNVPNNKLKRLLSKFWSNGMDRNALLPNYSVSGGLGREKNNTDRKRGRPRKNKTGVFDTGTGINIDETTKSLFKKALNKHYLGKDKLSIKDTYRELLLTEYSEEIVQSESNGTIPNIPTYEQLYYWKSKLIDKNTEIRKRNTEIDYLKNKRGLLGNPSKNHLLPGSSFEIDATVADVHIVSQWNRNHVVGRPTIYSIVDKASRMIAGLHVSLEYASWVAARQALVNAFTSKVDFCALHNIVITDQDWPCFHLPQQLLCDRGEMIGLKPQEYVSAIVKLDYAPPYRADFKAMVERRFGILNSISLHKMEGSTKGTYRIRGEEDPKAKAIFTLSELTEQLLLAVIEQNSSIFDQLSFEHPLLIEENLSPTPINTWNMYLRKHQHALIKKDPDEIKAKLLESTQVSMTKHGIEYHCCPVKQNLTPKPPEIGVS